MILYEINVLLKMAAYYYVYLKPPTWAVYVYVWLLVA